MSKKENPVILSNEWYRNPHSQSIRVTTAQWRQMLLDDRDSFMAIGKLWQLNATKVGPGVYELRATEKKLT